MPPASEKEQYLWNFLFTVAFIATISVLAYILYSDQKIRPVPLFDFALLVLATFRLIRLFMHDHITNYIRDFFNTFEAGPGKTISILLSCPWCTGVWMAFFISFFYFLTPFFWYPLFVIALAGAGTIAEIIVERIMRD